MESNNILFYAKNISEALFQIKNTPSSEVVGGCTLLKHLPEKAICIANNEELRAVSRHERYIDFGPGITLNEIISLGEERIPKVLYLAALNTANHFVRNMATLGGNICSNTRKGTLYAPLLALGASLRFRNAETQSVTTIPLEKFEGVPQNSLLVSVRVPNQDWDVEIFRRGGKRHSIDDHSSSFCFLAETEKSAIINVRMAFSGCVVVSSRDLENKLLGARLPLSENEIMDFSNAAMEYFEEASEKQIDDGSNEYIPLLKKQFLNLTRFSLNQLT